jgi:cobalt-zinc-cadmium efflux system protein
MKEFTHRPSKKMPEVHDHDHNHSRDHTHEYKGTAKKRLILSIVITGVIMILEIAGGIVSNSLALLSDAGHMFTHMFSLGISLSAIFIASRDPYSHRTYGLYRVEILAALLNSLFLFGVCGVIFYEGTERFFNPGSVHGMQMLVVALIGLAVNVASILILHKSASEDINIKAAFAHVMADAVSSVGVVIGAVVIHFTGKYWIDPVIAVLISVLIFIWAAKLFWEAVNVLLETAPRGMDVDTLKKDFREQFPEICDIYDMHVWVITTNMYMFSAHIALDRSHVNETNEIRERMNTWLMENHGIEHTTIEFDIEDVKDASKEEPQNDKE